MIKILIRAVLGLSLFSYGISLRGSALDEWPAASPEVLREELFGIRFRLALRDKGPKAAEKFLRDAMAKNMASEVKAYVAWVSLWSEAWGMTPILDVAPCETLLRQAVEEGSPLAADVLGRALIYGQKGITRDAEAGLKFLDLAVERGLPRAIARRGVFHVTGFGGTNVLLGALEVRRAAALGSPIGLVDLAESFETGANGLAPNLSLALEYYYLIALENDGTGWRKLEEFEQKGVANAALMRSLAYVRFANEGGFIVPSVVRHHLAVLEKTGQGDARALVELAVARLFGVDWVKRDPVLAKDYLTRAVRTGNAEAKFFLAYLRLRGLAGPQETEAALQEMTAMAEAGNVRAAARLGYFYYWGTSEADKLPKDPAQAFRYTRQAAQGGSKWAIVNLAHCYKHGIGTPENYALAAKLYWIATEYGAVGAKEDLVRNLAFAKVK